MSRRGISSMAHQQKTKLWGCGADSDAEYGNNTKDVKPNGPELEPK